MNHKVKRCIEKALLGEVMTTPKPGLVDLKDSGAHKDMDFHTFEKSTYAISPYLAGMFDEGYSWGGLPEQLFSIIREIGIQAETAMFRATKGVNTHKGIIFTMGILSASAGYLYQNQKHLKTDDILEIAKKMTRQTMKEEFEKMLQREPVTHGEILFHKYGEKGIRGQAEEGFPIIRDIAYPVLKQQREKQCSFSAANLNVLLSVMCKLVDTNVLTRSDQNGLLWVQQEAESIVKMGGAATQEGYQALIQMNQECILRNISPGGAADILAATLFLEQLESIL